MTVTAPSFILAPGSSSSSSSVGGDGEGGSSGDAQHAHETIIRIRVGGLTLRGKISPPLPATCRPDDPPLERQFGTLRFDGVAVQLRFAPCVASAAGGGGDESAHAAVPAVDEAGSTAAGPSPRFTPESPASACTAAGASATYTLLDGAFTADHLASDGRVALAAAGAAVATSARDVMAISAPAPRAGRSPEVWEPRPFDKESDGYDHKKPGKLAYDSRGEARNEEILAEIRRDTREWARTRDTCKALRERLEERRAHLAALNARKNFICELRRRLKNRRKGPGPGEHNRNSGGGGGGGGGGGEDEEETREEGEEGEEGEETTVTVDDIDDLRATAVVTETHLLGSNSRSGGGRGGTSPRSRGPAPAVCFDLLDVIIDDLEGCTIAELEPKLVECTRMCARALEGARELQREVEDRRSWDVAESGLETRDVLENGVRRADMERLLGRPVTKADVDTSLAIPAAARMRIVGGYDVQQARITGTHEYVKRLPSSSPS